MKFKLNRKKVILAGANLLCLAGYFILRNIGASQAAQLSWNTAAERWQGSSDTPYAQISCFIPEDAQFTTDKLGTVRGGVLDSLKTVSIAPEEGQKLCPDAYSAPAGQAEVSGTAVGTFTAELTAAGGDFFLIHDFTLIDGSFFSDEDVMQDGAVIDRNLAWNIYGSDQAAGMDIWINGVKFYVSGVIEVPQTEEERRCAGDQPRIYLSYDGAEAVSPPSEDGTPVRFKKITSYEIVMPDPVESYARQSVENLMAGYEDAEVICNTGRFGFYERLSALSGISYSTVKDSETVYPFWENASGIVEFRLSYIYLGAALCMTLPVLTVIWLAVKGIKFLRRNKKRIFFAALGLFRSLSAKLRRLFSSVRGRLGRSE